MYVPMWLVVVVVAVLVFGPGVLVLAAWALGGSVWMALRALWSLPLLGAAFLWCCQQATYGPRGDQDFFAVAALVLGGVLWVRAYFFLKRILDKRAFEARVRMTMEVADVCREQAVLHEEARDRRRAERDAALAQLQR